MVPGWYQDVLWIFGSCREFSSFASLDKTSWVMTPKPWKKTHKLLQNMVLLKQKHLLLGYVETETIFLKNNWLFVDSFFAFLCSCRDKNWSSWSLHLGLKYFSHPSFPKSAGNLSDDNMFIFDKRTYTPKLQSVVHETGHKVFQSITWKTSRRSWCIWHCWLTCTEAPPRRFVSNEFGRWILRNPEPNDMPQMILSPNHWDGSLVTRRPQALYHLYPSTLINPNSLPLKHVETSRSYAAMLAMLSVLLCALLCVSYVFLCLASWSL